MFEPYLALHASAGSGKTYALSVRYISLLYLGAHPSKILTLTFTNKAASEMKSRIFDTLKNLENKNELNDIAVQVGVSKQEILARKDEVLNLFLKEELHISTIDSFFTSILRKFALNAGFMPDFKVDDSIFEYGFLEKFLRICIQNKKYPSLIKFAINEDKKLSSMFDLLKNFYNKEGEFDASIFPKSEFKNAQRVLQLSEELKELYAQAGASKTAVGSFDNADIAQLLTRAFVKYDDITQSRNHKKYTTPKMQELFCELKVELKSYIEAREKYILGELGELYSIYKATLRAINKEFSALSFSDVSVLIYTLLKNEISKEFLYFRLDSKIEHMLIDEYQDTNVLQYKILEPLMAEIVAGIGTKEFKSLFFVGDIKQSIYRFRGGSKELFEHTIEEFGVKRDILDTNYRSKKHVVEFVNETFDSLIKGYENQKVNSKKDGFVSVQIDEDITNLVIENVKELLNQGVAYKDIAILVHENKEALFLQEELINNIKDVKVQIGASIKLRKMPLIAAIIDLLKYAYFKDILYLQNFLVVIGKSFKDKPDVSWINLDLTPIQLISLIVKKFEIFDNDKDIITLLEIANRYTDIESFLFECDNFSEDAKSEDNNGIKILTIHKSKGLEFEHVLVVDRLKNPRAGSGSILYEYEDIHLKAIYQRVKSREFFDDFYKRAKEKEEQLSLEDKLNMYYVAFTRAESSLFIIAKEKSSAFEMLNLSQICMGDIEVKEEIKEEKQLIKMQENLVNFGAQSQDEKEESEFNEADIFATQYGLALHYCLEMMREFDEKSLQIAYNALMNKYSQILRKEDLQSVYKRVLNLINHEKFQSLVQNAKAYKEQPIVYNRARKQIDLLLIKEDEVIIVDYKSSSHVHDAHLVQVDLYQKALQEIYDKKVSAYICYLREEEIEFINL